MRILVRLLAVVSLFALTAAILGVFSPSDPVRGLLVLVGGLFGVVAVIWSIVLTIQQSQRQQAETKARAAADAAVAAQKKKEVEDILGKYSSPR